MRDFVRACSAEVLKLKRTLALWLALLTPLLMVLLQSMFVVRTRRLGRPLWRNLEQGTIGWAILLLPLTAALLTALLNGMEHRESNWKQLFALPLARRAVYGAKWVAAELLLALAHVVLWGALLGAGLLLHALCPALPYGSPPWLELLGRVGMMWAAAGALIAIHLWISFRAKSFTVPLGLGIAAVVVSVVAARDSTMTFWPWMFPANVTSVERQAAAVALGAIGGLVVLGLGAWDAERRDVL